MAAIGRGEGGEAGAGGGAGGVQPALAAVSSAQTPSRRANRKTAQPRIGNSQFWVS
jgi:hypothetical protein